MRIDSSAPLTTQSGADDAWHAGAVTVSFSATDAASGVQRTEYRLDAGEWTAGSQVTVASEGDHLLRYRSLDVAGNLEEARSCHVKIDKTAPLTTQAGADGRWHNLAVTVRFTATDAGAGVAETLYSTDGGASWSSGTSLEVAAPADHSQDGAHAILYLSRDVAGHSELPRSCSVKIDTRQPVTAALSTARVERGARATLRYRVSDRAPCAARANVTIKITTLSGRLVKVFRLGQRAVNRNLGYQFRCTLAKRTYRYKVFATDAAGNKQAVVGGNRLVVR